jgi:hypothetical protein
MRITFIPAYNPPAISATNAFINKARARSGEMMTFAQTEQLLKEAHRIKAVVGCP